MREDGHDIRVNFSEIEDEVIGAISFEDDLCVLDLSPVKLLVDFSEETDADAVDDIPAYEKDYALVEDTLPHHADKCLPGGAEADLAPIFILPLPVIIDVAGNAAEGDAAIEKHVVIASCHTDVRILRESLD